MVKGSSYWISIRAASGFTVIELMVVLVIAAILAAIAAPSLRQLVAANQLNALTDALAAALSSARSEAAKLNTNVTLTTAGGTNWGSGWTMAVTGPAGAGMPSTLRTGAPAPIGYTLYSNAPFSGSVTFDPTGRLVGAAGEFVFCQNKGPANGGKAQMITVAPSGRVRIAQNDASGNPIADDTTSVTTCTP